MGSWLWEALTAVSPHLVVVEIQGFWGDAASVTILYSDDFSPVWVNGYHDGSASLAAFVGLARKKGHRLVGVNQL
jgi:hypothetical protein